jgi:hypothetical protein
MAEKLGDEFWAPSHGLVEPLLREYSKRKGTENSVLRRWYNHYRTYGEVMPDAQLWINNRKKKGRDGSCWEQADTDCCLKLSKMTHT